MPDPGPLLLAAACGLALGVAVGVALGRRRGEAEREESASSLAGARELVVRLQERLAAQERAEARAAAGAEHRFRALAAEALASNSEEFLRLAHLRLSAAGTEQAVELERQARAVDDLVRPLRERLADLTAHARELERRREASYAALREETSRLGEVAARLGERSAELTAALKGSSRARGLWGEMALRNVVELAGMTRHCDFVEQQADARGNRPDLVVRLPGGGRIPVDAKAPFAHYLQACESEQDERREALLDEHAAAVRARVREVAGRDYGRAQEGPLDLVVLFLPVEAMLSVALERDPGLHAEALRKGILLATPVTLVALLRTIGLAWRHERLAEDSQRIAAAATELHDRVAVFGERLAAVGKGLSAAVDGYNAAVGSFERRVLPAGRRLVELGAVAEEQALAAPPPVESPPRTLHADG